MSLLKDWWYQYNHTEEDDKDLHIIVYDATARKLWKDVNMFTLALQDYEIWTPVGGDVGRGRHLLHVAKAVNVRIPFKLYWY